MRLTSWKIGHEEFLVLRFYKTNVLLPAERDVHWEYDKPQHTNVNEQGSSPIGLLADCCHVVLLSSPWELLGLPALLSSLPYQEDLPDIYCTRDCLRVAEQLITELATHELWDFSNVHHEAEDGHQRWTLHQVLETVQVVTYGEVACINDVAVQATAYANGMGIGCATWILSTPSSRLGYIPRASLHHPFAALMDPASIQNLDVLLLGPACMALAEQLPSSTQTRLSEVCALIVNTLEAGGNVLLPVVLTGTMLSLVEEVPTALEAAGFAPGLPPVLCVSPAASRALMVGITAADSLSSVRQQHMLSGQHPFPFHAAIQSGRLLVAESLADGAVQSAWGSPACVFVSASSLRHGAGSQLLQKWAYEDNSRVILTDAGAVHGMEQAVRSQLPPEHGIKVCNKTGHVGLSLLELAHLLEAAKPQQLVLPDAAWHSLKGLPEHSRGATANMVVHSYSEHQTLKVPTHQLSQPSVMTAQMAAAVQLQELTSQFAAARLACNLQFQEGEWHVTMLPLHESRQPCLWGKVDTQQLLRALEEHGAEVDVTFEDGQEGGQTVVHMLNWEAVVRLSSNTTMIEANSPRLRPQLAALVTGLLQRF